MADGQIEISADVLRYVRVRCQRDRHALGTGCGEKGRIRVQLSMRLVQARARDLDRDAVERARDPIPVPVDLVAEELHQVGVREGIEEPASCRAAERFVVPAPSLLGPDGLDEARHSIDPEPVEEVDRAQDVVPRIRRERLRRLLLAAGLVVDLDPELHGMAAALRLDDGLHVRLDVVDAPLEVIGHRPERTRPFEVVDVLGEADLVHAPLRCSLDEALDRVDGVVDRFVRRPEVHVVVDDHSQVATSSRSAGVVTLSRRGSPSTTRTRPPRASTRVAQSGAEDTSPLSAPRRTEATNA